MVVNRYAGYVVYLFENDERKGRTEDLWVLSEYAEEESADQGRKIFPTAFQKINGQLF
ncbi:MAG TPA: hypothetical protein VF026_05515 [Ktedonobacteraceae bacterium]